MKTRDYKLQFSSLSERSFTDMIVIHHTGSVVDMDASAEEIHNWHINQGWAGCGYHFIIRKDGTVELGRPEWAVGSHAYGENSHTLGIHISGDFEAAQPTEAQISACAELVHDLCKDYNIAVNRENIVGHCDLMATDCPGKNLYSRIEEIISLAKDSAPAYQGTPVKNVYDLARKYESAGDCAATGNCFGLYQFTKATSKQFVTWLKNYHDEKLANYGKFLEDAEDFAAAWRHLGTVDPGHFSELQDEFARDFYLDTAADLFEREYYHVNAHSLQMQAVIFARAIQHGVFGALELFKRACPYPNLSYVDEEKFDVQLISAVYDYLILNPNFVTTNNKIHAALINRFKKEKADALA